MDCLALIVLLATAAPPDAPEPLPAAQVEVQAQAIARGRRLLLMDLAQVKCSDPELAERLRQVDLGLPPAEGWGRRVARAMIESAIKDCGIALEDLTISGASESEVFSRSVRIQPEEVEHAAELVLRSALSTLGEQDVEWTLARRVSQRIVPAGRVGIDLTSRLRQGRIGRDSAIVDVTIRVDGEPDSTVPVSFTLRRYREVLIALSSIPAGTPLDESRVAPRRVDLSRFFGEPLEDPALLMGKVASRTLAAGTILTALDSKEPEIVRKGEMVTMVASRGNLKVTARGIAAQGGALGDVIRITNPTTQKIVIARVAGPGVAEVVTN